MLWSLLFVTFSIFLCAACSKINITDQYPVQSEKKEVLEDVKYSVEDKHMVSEGSKTVVLSKKSDCNSNNCKKLKGVENDTSESLKIQRYKFVKTPPKAYNFLATMPTVLPSTDGASEMVLTENVGIYPLVEKGNASDWQTEYEYVLVDPEEENSADGRQSTKTTSHSSLEDSVKQDSIYKQSTLEGTNKTPKLKDISATIRSKDYTLSMKVFTKKDKSKIIKIKKFRNGSKPIFNEQNNSMATSSTEPSSSASIDDLKIKRYTGYKRPIDDLQDISSPSTDTESETNNYPFIFFPNSNRSFRIIPYPIDVNGIPETNNKSVAFPFQYYIPKYDGKGVRLEDIGGGTNEDNKNDLDNHFEYYKEMENDEDYIPSTDEYSDIAVTTDDFNPASSDDFNPVTSDIFNPATSGIFNPATSEALTKSPNASSKGVKPTVKIVEPITSRARNKTFATGVSYHFLVSENASPKYPDPYIFGSIYSYYDCKDVTDAAAYSRYETSFLLATYYLFVF